MINRNKAMSISNWQLVSYKGHGELKRVIDEIYDSVGSCEKCEYSEKTTNTRWKCEWLDDIRVRPNFFCADYVRSKKC